MMVQRTKYVLFLSLAVCVLRYKLSSHFFYSQHRTQPKLCYEFADNL